MSRRCVAWFVFVSAVVSVVVVSSSACGLPGPESLLGDANVEVVVTGLRADDVVAVDVDAAAFSQTAVDHVITFFLQVPAGEHEGSLVIDRGDDALCAAFVVNAPGAGIATVGVDVSAAAPCPQDPLGRSFGGLEEIVVGDCGNASCTTTTTIDADGLVVVEVAGEPRVTGQARAADNAILRLDVLSAEADVLFAGECELRPNQPRESVELVRITVLDGQVVEESVDISSCRSSIAARLRAQLALLREDVQQ